MRILEYTLGLPPFRRGGLPRYSTDLSEELAKNNDVYLMYPGQINPYSEKIKLTEKNNEYPFKTIEMRNPLPVSLGLGIRDEKRYMEKRDISALKEFVKRIDPEVVHLHTLMGMPKEFLIYLHNKKIKIVYTTHDFYGLCPKMLNKDPKNELLYSKCSYDCVMCNVGPSYKKIVVMQSHLYERFKENLLVKAIRSKNKTKISNNVDNVILNKEKAELRFKLREYYLSMFSLIDVFHFNSTISKQYFQQFIPNIKGKVISITHKNLKDYRRTKIVKTQLPAELGYIGPYDKKKGFFLYTQVLKELHKNYKFKANFYGDIIDNTIFQNSSFVNHGILSEKRLNIEYQKMDLLIVPSLWHETFGYVVLEALLMGVPCLVSNNVGAKDLVPDSWIFCNKNELRKKLSNLIDNPKNLDQMKAEVNHLTLKYKMDEHVKSMMNLYR